MRVVLSKRRRLAGMLVFGLFTSIASNGHAQESNVAATPLPPLPSSAPYTLTGDGSSVERVMQVAHAQPTPGGTLPPVIVDQPSTTPATPLPGVTPTDPYGNTGPVNPGPNLAPGELHGYIPLRDQFLATGGSIMPGATSATRGLDMSLFDSPNDITIIGPQLLDERQSSDMARALQNEVGVLVQSTARGQSSPFIRGLTGQQVVILIDGVRLNNSTFRAGPNQYFNTIDPGMVERIEVVRGAQSVLWGADAIGGVINVVTKSPSRNSGNYGDAGFKEIFSTADLASYTRMSVETWTGDRGIYGGASYMNVNDLDIGGGRGRQPFTDYDQYAGDLKVQQLLDVDNILTISMQHFEQQDVPRSDRFAPFTSTPRPTFFDVQQRDMLNLRLDGLTNNNVLYDGYSLTFNYSRQKEGVNERRLNANGSTNRFEFGEFDVNTFGTVLTLVKDFEDAGKLSYGADFYYDDVDAVRTRTINNSNPVPPANQNVTPQFPNDSTYDRVGVYAMYEIPLTERLTVMPGIRYESANAEGTTPISNVPTFVDRSYDDWVASVGLNYKLTDECALVGGYYEGYRAPNLDDLFADVSFAQGQFQTISSVNVGPEYSQTYEVGLKVDTDDFRMQVFQYWNNFENAILRYPVNAQGQFAPNGTNVIRDNSDSYIYGTELGGEYLLDSWGHRGWSLYGNVWYTYGVDLGTNEVGAPSEPFSRIPPLTGTFGTRWRSAHTKQWLDVFVFAADRADRYSLLNSQDARFIPGGTPGYATLNARTGTRWGRNDCHEVAVGLENITDKYYRVLGSGVDGAGINAIFTYGYTW